MQFCGVIPQDLAVGALWPQIAGLVARALPYGRGEYTLDDVRDGVARGELFVIGIANDRAHIDFCAVCSVAEYPRRRVLYVIYGAGRGAARAREALISAAKTLNCDWIETRCRESVARLDRKAGFETGYQVCLLEIPQ
jgi:hypothetical protein